MKPPSYPPIILIALACSTAVAWMSFLPLPAVSQVQGSLPAFVKLQSVTPGTTQTGHSNLSGTMTAGQVVVGSGPADGGLKVNGTFGGVGLNANGLLFTVPSLTFVGVGRSTRVTGAEVFGTYSPTTTGCGGMYAQTGTGGRPFYGYASGASANAYHYFDTATNSWILNVGGSNVLQVNTTGWLGVATNPTVPLDIAMGGYNVQTYLDNDLVPSISSVGSGANLGQLRLRNNVSVFPSSTGNPALLSVRGSNFQNRFLFDGGNGLLNLNDPSSAIKVSLSSLDGSALFQGPLTANDNSYVKGTLRIDSSGANNGSDVRALQFGANGTGEFLLSNRSGATNQFGFDVFTNSQPRLSVTNAGFVGVGFQNPSVNLEVKTQLNVSNTSKVSKVRIQASPLTDAGYVNTFGPNGNYNTQCTWVNGAPNNGFLGSIDQFDITQASAYVDVSGLGIIVGDQKNFKVPNPRDDKSDIWYCSIEGPEAAMYVRGTGHLVNGRAHVDFPEHFIDMAVLDGMSIQLTPGSFESEGLAYMNLTVTGFIVGELHKGRGNYDFSWEAKCVRKGHEDYKVVRPWDDVLPGSIEKSEAWANRRRYLSTLQKRSASRP